MLTRSIVARAPTRLDFGGSLTDVPPYPEREGGAACCVAITRYATATVQKNGHAHGASTNQAGDRLLLATLSRLRIADIDTQLTIDYPVGAGLGGSSAAGVAIAGALAAFSSLELGPRALAALSRDIEVQELGVPGGYQDHYAAAFGGTQLLHFGETVEVDQIPLSAQCRLALAQRGIVVYTGETRLSANTVVLVRDAYCAGGSRVVNALARMKALAFEMAEALRAEDLDTLGTLVGEHWTHQRSLHPAITTPRIDAIINIAARCGALGSKALGASGGGCVLAIAAQGREDELAQALAPLGKRIHYAVDTTGFAIIERGEDRNNRL
jgi:D-glycero-alpha-D-manno-heptose-7-phosphate kinase